MIAAAPHVRIEHILETNLRPPGGIVLAISSFFLAEKSRWLQPAGLPRGPLLFLDRTQILRKLELDDWGN